MTALQQDSFEQDDVDGPSEQLHGLIETDAQLIPGDSGGPLLTPTARSWESMRRLLHVAALVVSPSPSTRHSPRPRSFWDEKRGDRSSLVLA